MSTHNANSTSLVSYLEKVESGSIQIPEFQRDFVWAKTNMIKLITSLLKKYPIGSFLLMNNSQNYAKRRVEGAEKDIENSVDCDLILDGQQRTTSLYQILYGKGKFKFYFNYKLFIETLEKEGINDAQDEKLESVIEDNLEELIAVFERTSKKTPDTISKEYVEGLFPLDIIFKNHKGMDYTNWLSRYAFDQARGDSNKFERITTTNSIFTSKLINNIISYQVSLINIDGDTSPNIVCTIFETINQTGVKLTIIDLINAKCFPSGFLLSQEIDKIFEEYPIFQNFDNDEKNELIGITLMKIIGLLKRNVCKKSILLSLTPSEIKETWQTAVSYLKNGLEFMHDQFGVLGIRYLPYKDMLPAVSTIINNKSFDKNNQEHLNKLSKWYWCCVFSNYFDSATETKTASSVNEFLGTDKEKGWIDNDSNIPSVLRNNQANLLQSEFNELEDAASVQSAIYKAVLNLMILNGSCDFSDERKKLIEFQEKDLEDHHIFPKKFLSLQTPTIKPKEINCVLNRTLISKTANQKIKDKQPAEYFCNKDIIGNKEFSADEASKHCIHYEFINSKYAKGSFSHNNYKVVYKNR